MKDQRSMLEKALRTVQEDRARITQLKRSVNLGELIDESESMVLAGFAVVGISGLAVGLLLGWIFWGHL